MQKLFDYIEYKPWHVILLLIIFHFLIASLMSWVANSPYLVSLHNGEGFWKFAIDSTLYHKEALALINVLNKGEWMFWWSSYPTHLHVKWLAFLYWLFNTTNPLLFEVINSVIWVASVLLVYRAGFYLFNKDAKLACFSALFLFFPSIVVSSTQLLREPFYILGLCFILFGWVTLYRLSSGWNGALSIIVGFYLVVATRDYITPIIFSVFSIWVFVAIFNGHVKRAPILVMLFFIYVLSFGNSLSGFLSPFEMKGNGFVAEVDTTGLSFDLPGTISYKIVKQEIRTKNNVLVAEIDEIIEENGKYYIFFNSQLIEISNPQKDFNLASMTGSIRLLPEEDLIEVNLSLLSDNERGDRPEFMTYLDTKVAQRLGAMRHGFRKVNINSGSGIDENVRYRSIEDILIYFPRAFQVGFLSPFPQQWFSPGHQTGRIGKLLAGLETSILYLTFIGFFWALFRNKIILLPVIPILIFSGCVIVLLGFAVPNVGTIYRMRQGLLIPYYMIGVYGISVLFLELKLKFKNRAL